MFGCCSCLCQRPSESFPYPSLKCLTPSISPLRPPRVTANLSPWCPQAGKFPKFVSKEMEAMYIEELKSSVNQLMANLESMPVSKGGEFKLQKLKRGHNTSIIDMGQEDENTLSKSDVVLSFTLEVRMNLTALRLGRVARREMSEGSELFSAALQIQESGSFLVFTRSHTPRTCCPPPQRPKNFCFLLFFLLSVRLQLKKCVHPV